MMDPPPPAGYVAEEMAAEGPVPECPICYLSYDNIFHTPLILPCSHTFCLECLARLCAFLKPDQPFQCPLCRESSPLPWGGILKLPANMDIVQQFPPWMRELQLVWQEGFRLCWLKRLPENSEDAAFKTLVTVDLLTAASQDTAPGNLVAVHRPTRWQMCSLLWEQHPNIFWAAGLLALLVLLPMALILAWRP